MKNASCFLFLFLIYVAHNSIGQRHMENLDRGVVAFRTGSNQAFVSWRLMGNEDPKTGFNLYKVTGSDTTKLNSSPILGGTNWRDNAVDFSKINHFFVTTVIDQVEGEAGNGYSIKANQAIQEHPYIGISLEPITSNPADYKVHFVWIGDLDGDGAYDYVIDRLPTVDGNSPKIEAYKSDGTFLWRMDTGPLGANRNNIEGGASTISNGHWDGLTVYDLDSDGKAEVIVKTAKGFVFGDGWVENTPSTSDQFVAVCDGLTGSPRSQILMPTDYKVDGPLQSHFGIGYLNAVKPSVIVKSKNRKNNGAFNKVVAAYSLTNNDLTEQWKVLSSNYSDFHQIRILDVDQDGKDEICDGGYVIDDNGEILYALKGVIHGDRFHISDIDPNRPGLEGFGIQQDNPSALATYYYDAGSGEVLKTYFTDQPQDMGRGNMGDYFSNQKGMEFWSFNGMFSGQNDALVMEPTAVPWPNFRIWWDGDLGSELLDRTKVDDLSGGRLFTGYKMGASESDRGAPIFYGDIIGDWREEIIFENTITNELQIFSTTISSNERIYTLPHNPAYRNCFTYKGYLQSNHVDYFLGFGMDVPPTPNIKIVTALGNEMMIDSISLIVETDVAGSLLGKCQIWIKNDFDRPVSGAKVNGAFSGSFVEDFTGVTNEAGLIEFVTSLNATNNDLKFEFCISSVSHDKLAFDVLTNLNAMCQTYEQQVEILGLPSAVQVYPNPCKDQFFIPAEITLNTKLATVYSIKGERMKNVPVDGNKVDVSSLHNGRYFVLVENNFYKVIVEK